ncbi:MAG: type IV toxin-antitoxin system AbiEi family antitoxin domain-containing protein [Ancrocorticia sp.]
MKSRNALRVLGEVTESQWGMVTSAQARARGVSHMNLTRLSESGDLVRLSHGIYRDAGAPIDEHEELKAAWLAAEPAKLAYERLAERPINVVVSGESAAKLLGIGDLRAMASEFTTPARKQTQRPDVRYRTRVLPERDITVREGLPVTTRERTISDLVEDRQDLSIVGAVLRDAARQSRLDVDRLSELLGPLAGRNGCRDGDELLEKLMVVAGIDEESVVRQIASLPSLGELIVVLKQLQKTLSPLSGADRVLAMPEILDIAKRIGGPMGSMQDIRGQLAEQLAAFDLVSLAEAASARKDVADTSREAQE